MTENEILKKAQEGDKQALAELVKMYEKTIYNFSYKICRNKDKAEHTMQETFLSMIKNIMSFKGESKLSSWLYRVVSNNCLMYARKEQKHLQNILEDDGITEREFEIADENQSPVKAVEESELKEILDAAIGKLQPDYRVVFLLRDVEGLSTEETAEILNLTQAAVKSRLFRARSFLRDYLNKRLSYDDE
jgi:RNA polymerase sigma-70 factor, ECF subfamily